MEKEKPKPLIAMVEQFDQLVFNERYHTSDTAIKIIIALLHDDGKPRNWSHGCNGWNEAKNSTGGCWARLFPGDKNPSYSAVYFSAFGPNISYASEVAEYRHALRAMELINKRIEAMTVKRGRSMDAADELGRWLEACGVTTVYRPREPKYSTWLNEIDWRTYTIGEIVNDARRNFPKQDPEEVIAEPTPVLQLTDTIVAV